MIININIKKRIEAEKTYGTFIELEEQN